MGQYKYKLILKEQEEPTTDEPISSKEATRYDLVLTPVAVSPDEVVKALENIDNYGPYISNLRNTKSDIEKAVEDHFGPNQRFKKLKLEKERGKPFPPKTKQSVDDFIKSVSKKPNLLNWKIEADSLIFPYKKNPSKQTTKNIIDTVMKTADIDYNIEEKEAITEDKSLFNIDPNLAFKIYDVLSKDFSEIKTEYPTKTSFYHYLNSGLSSKSNLDENIRKIIKEEIKKLK